MAYKMALTKWNLLKDCLKRKGITYHFDKLRNDGFIYKSDNDEGLTKFHIHSFEKAEGYDMCFTKLLPKSSNWRSGDQVDLAILETSQWTRCCEGMDPSVISAVEALSQCFDKLGAELQA